ncbi:KLH10 protein, partial [Brachypteracias leptosomus]|nr:KLH10 protein [Brachypteracias leptosomus]
SSSHMERSRSPMSCTIFNELRLEGEHCDATISVDGVEFSVHKIVLCRVSDYFRALFSSRWEDTEKGVYKIQHTSPEMMRLIIEYAYTGMVPVTAHNVEDLLITADYFNVVGIVGLCCEFLKSQLSLENCISFWSFTDTYYCPELREAAHMFILNHFMDMTEVPTQFLELPVNDLKDIIEKDELNVAQEEKLFKAVVQWVAYDPQNRRQHMASLLSKVRLARMRVEYLNKVRTHPYVRDNQECKVLIIQALIGMSNLNMYGPGCSASRCPLSRPRLPSAILFAIGGWSEDSPTNTIETYDARADQWVNVTCEEEGPLAYHGAVYLKDSIYVVGGFDGRDCLSSVRRFNLLQKTWQEVGSMHSRRCYVSVTILNDNIYAMGGFDGHVRLSTAERYEPETNQWTMISCMHERRSDASATTLHRKVYICGGFNGIERSITAEVYDPTTNQWTFITPMSCRRGGVGVAAYGDEVYVVGGCDGTSRLCSVEIYNPMTNAWRVAPNMLTPRSNFGLVVMEHLLFVVGGFNGSTMTFNVEYYDRSTNEWHSVCDMGTQRSALSCCVVPTLPNAREYAARRD